MPLPTIADTSERIRSGEISPVEVLQECLAAVERLNPVLNAFITVMAESASREAKQAEKEIAQGNWRGPLHGIPVGLKDLIDTAGVRTTAASAVFRNRVPDQDADVVKQLKAAGAVIIGKQNLHEFAYGGSSLISCFGPVRNPVNPDYIAGGSSGGSAAAVSSGMCYAAIGTDTAGSIRQPAALCGIVGLKPSYGVVSARGVVPLSVSLDHVGPLSRSVEDAAAVLDTIAQRATNYRASLGKAIGRAVLGVPRRYFFEDLDPAIASSVEAAMTQMQKVGFDLRELDIPVDTDRTLQMAEAYEYHRDRIARSPELYDPETLRRVRSGEGVSEEAYREAKRALEKERQRAASIFDNVDALVMPTTPIVAPGFTELMNDLRQLRPAELILLRNTRPVNVWGLPAISVPCGFSADGLPMGLQIVGAPQRDGSLLQIAHAFERARNSCL